MSDIVQGSDAWKQSRLGKVTASRMADLTAKTKTGYSTSRANYQAEKLIERLTGNAQDTFINDAMRWGTEQEPHARLAYEFYKGVSVSEIGFVDHPIIRNAGASPDGLCADDGMIEIKCPMTATYLDIYESEKIPERYIKQMQFQMACCERQWCDFVAFDPRLPEEMNLFVKRIGRDESLIGSLEIETTRFLEELDIREAAIRAKYIRKAN
jgi:putative phage-type endonuclease